MSLVLLVSCVHSPGSPTPAAPVSDPAATDWLGNRDTAALSAALADRSTNPGTLRDAVLARIAALDHAGPGLSAVIAVDVAAAPAVAEGPLFGLPVLLKDNLDTAGFATTVGSLALAGHRPVDDAFLVARLREAGAVLVGKASLSEWSNFRSDPSSSGWSAVGGQVRNPYVLDRSPVGRAPARRSPWRRATSRSRSGPRPTGRSSVPHRLTGWSGSNRPSAS